ncbi:hypothetical protein [Seleniivibrio woodruffii]|uniref:Uncharacterized protein n=2 Tax=Seleniivibrio woodruffii TaxID=1078050 RepID=A0A4R1K6W7_9BACT|nr:hypothetical protein [Seleniivibrio woodruffii]TCK59996.1 hypothetical protein C8D98_2168 [Seleniivibrio woodruffii]TVZ35783.1 hypothetical protein OF66_1399 [Seleniivibrio woodruffii]
MLIISGTFAWFTGILSAGSGGLIFLPVSALFLQTGIITPVTAIASLLSDSEKMLRYGNNACPVVLKASIPFTIVGAGLGVFLFSVSDLRVYAVFLFLFYLANSVYSHKFYGLGRIPVFFGSVISGYLGVTALNTSMTREEEGSFFVLCFMRGITMLSAYLMFGVLTADVLIYGIMAGIGALAGGYLGRRYFSGFQDRFLRFFVKASLIACIVIILAGQL